MVYGLLMIFFASNWVLGRDFHHKKFHPFSWPISGFIGVGGLYRERLALFFRRFFNFRPSFPIQKVKSSEILFLHMIRVDVIHNRK